ncbi:MAG: DLW-39 family protein [Mycobacteriales bacterium]|nr:DLW-39 family protein [Mycobacteriales bacterium]
MRKPALILALLGAAAAVLRKRKAARAEKDLWTEATTTPDLR